MKNNWKDGNMLLKEARYEYQGYEYEDFYYKIIFTYNTKEDRDEIFDWLKESSNYDMFTLSKVGDDKIKVIKYLSINYKSEDNLDIEKWVEDIAEESNAVSSEISESSYEEYHDNFFEKMKKRNLRESRFYNHLFKDKELSELYEKLKNAIGASDLCDEISSSMDKEELKKILNHLVEMYL